MNYGYFDEFSKEYVINRPDTPAPWCNYLGSVDYGAIISNNATGYSFVKSGASGRIIRFRFNSSSNDQPGRYIYIRDNSDGDFWSGSWQPVCKPLDKYKSECRHGTAYTQLSSKYRNLETKTLYFVPLNESHEIWQFKIKNTGNAQKSLSVYGMVEFTNHDHYENDTVNLQYSQFISKTYFKGDHILQVINENGSEASSDVDGHCDVMGDPSCRFFGVAGQTVSAFDGERDAFIGNYRNYGNPIAVETGKCSNTPAYNCNSFGALQIDITLKPGEEKEMLFVLGSGNEAVAKNVLEKYRDKVSNKVNATAGKQFEALKKLWHARLNNLQVNTPDDNLDNMVNVWNAYQCFITFLWSRAASFQYCGLRNGLGYRDTVQDIQGIIHLDDRLARERLLLMLSAQVSNGGGLPLVKFDHKAGEVSTPDESEYAKATGQSYYRADDALWLFPTIITYIKESGDWSFIDEVIPYADKGEATVYNHLRQAIRFNLDRQGNHGFPAGLFADWNDCLRLGPKGESMFVAFQLYYALAIFKEFAVKKSLNEDAAWADSHLNRLSAQFEQFAWQQDQYVRGFTEDGYTMGAKENAEANIWLNPQTWSVISGAAEGDKAKAVLNSVYSKLNTKYGARLFYPPFKKYGMPVARMVLFNEGTKENAGIFSQPQGWLILAETIVGNGNRAYEYFTEINPASMNDNAEIRKLEPYVHGQATESIDTLNHGRSHVHWLTGTASTVMVSLVNGILGLQPQYEGISINPCIPSKWEAFSMNKIFRGKMLNIKVENVEGVEKGVKYIVVNGKKSDGCYISCEELSEVNDILVVMGKQKP
ncbi:cellobiose phosphorylase [Ruminiclostridium sufflavum DSM 19573]|uniref:Cellobiose phosphorylase n=1 Tax=Ruminiclostridium sufflavum DSM 19573 TaxID=1121337 RepID=A0A318XIT7_9FIRM|nr:N,N'-diacetylchitobiose phosphorylase [Ruminiclostridium sufflavum]PYG87140.1 cellobiose phosphorylase [Ruminiclostridium sufflavum DSM 19573]